MIGTKVLVSAIGLTVLFAHVEAEKKVTGSIRGEEGRELKSGSKSNKGGRCESSKSKKGSKNGWYWYGPPKDDSKICKVFNFLDDHHHNHHGGGYGGNRQLAVQGECFNVEDYCHLIDHLHPGFNDMVCPCPYETVKFPYYYGESTRYQGYGEKYPPYKEEKVCPPKGRYGGGRGLKSPDHYDEINRYGKFCSKALGFEYKPVKEGYGAVEASYRDEDDGDCYDGCRKYVEYCCCKFGDSGKHYY